MIGQSHGRKQAKHVLWFRRRRIVTEKFKPPPSSVNPLTMPRKVWPSSTSPRMRKSGFSTGWEETEQKWRDKRNLKSNSGEADLRRRGQICHERHARLGVTKLVERLPTGSKEHRMLKSLRPVTYPHAVEETVEVQRLAGIPWLTSVQTG